MVTAGCLTRRRCLAGCAVLGLPAAAPAAGPAPEGRRSMGGAYLARPGPNGPAGASSMFARWGPPSALAILGPDMLVADPQTARVWRVDLQRQTMRGMAGVGVALGLLLALGPDRSAWVLDAPARQVLRFAHDGRLLRTLRLPLELLPPQAMVLADDAGTLLLADGLGAQWVELRGDAAEPRWVVPRRPDGRSVGSVDALAVRGDAVYLLDRHHGVVWHAGRDGRVAGAIGHGELLQPRALAAGAGGRLLVHDAGDACLKLLQGNAVVAKFDADALGLAEIGPMASDDAWLGVADAQNGPVMLYPFAGVLR
jgi:hypothetical protein